MMGRQMKLKDQVAIVTGAGRNIGEEIAKLFAAEGAKVAIVDLDKPRGERVVGAIREAGGEAQLFIADVSKGNDVAALVKAVVERFGRIDILVNNVAISDNKHIFDISEEEWDKVLAVTLKSQFLMGKHVAQQMAAQGSGGRIVNIGSTSGFMGRSRAVAYSAAKGGVANLTRAMAAQLAPHKIRVIRVRPRATGAEHGQAAGPTAGGRQGGAVPGERGFLVRLRRQSVRRRRRLGDGFVVIRDWGSPVMSDCETHAVFLAIRGVQSSL